MNIGGLSVGGFNNYKEMCASILMPGVQHMRHTFLPEHKFVKGQPETGAELADDLETIAIKFEGEIAACIVEPIAGSTGALIPPKGYLERIREICTEHDILLIFDEVITGFGRLGAPFAAQYFNVEPDLITCAKGLTSGTVPMGAVMVKKEIYDAFQDRGPMVIDLFHGYTYSAHPLAAAALIATLDVYQEDELFKHAKEMSSYWEDALHSLRDTKHVIDVRNLGLVAGVEMETRDGKPGARGYDVFTDGFHNHNILLRYTGDTLALSPPLIAEKEHIDQIVETLKKIIPNH
jgi:beta-alanine--pyruvate transaminase